MDGSEQAPRLARRSANRKSTMKSGRVIGEKREKLETASEREAAHRKIHLRQVRRTLLTVLVFTLLGVGLFFIGTAFMKGDVVAPVSTSVDIPYAPTIEVVDLGASAAGGHISSRMNEYIGQLESDLREYGIVPVRAVIPVNSIREIDIYLDGYSGYLKTTVDRGAGVTAEDADRMLRYLTGQGIASFEYIDLRLDGKAYWK
ncbi:hypothetical protein IJ117_00290 [Candidatus Saccharibacteria bacterium]|nr:hypothetical protein [Candidatus Saccharibacteria bacterium]